LLLLGVPLGTIAAIRKHTWLDNLIVSVSVIFSVVPIFVVAYIALMVLVLWLKVMEVPFGWRGLLTPGGILCMLLLAAPSLSIVIQETRAGVLDVLASDYVRTARGKGLGPLRVVVRHIMPNAVIPVITTLGVDMAYIVTGTVFIDRVFSVPGFGQLYWRAIERIDYPVLLATTVFASLFICFSNLLVDILYAIIDPRVRYVGRSTQT
jgi:ABC-type dipeptide/oligopeptide/nickel transport system permease component